MLSRAPREGKRKEERQLLRRGERQSPSHSHLVVLLALSRLERN